MLHKLRFKTDYRFARRAYKGGETPDQYFTDSQAQMLTRLGAAEVVDSVRESAEGVSPYDNVALMEQSREQQLNTAAQATAARVERQKAPTATPTAPMTPMTPAGEPGKRRTGDR